MKKKRLLRFVFGVFGGLLLASPINVHGQTVLRDHLICWSITDYLNANVTVDLDAVYAQYSRLGCTIGRAREFCVPAAKLNVTPPPPRADITGEATGAFIRYDLSCPSVPYPTPMPGVDQFGVHAPTKVFYAKFIEVPVKLAPIQCGADPFTPPTDPLVCGGICPLGGQCVVADGVCACSPPPPPQPPPPCDRTDAYGQCPVNGSCPIGEYCLPVLLTAYCGCGPLPCFGNQMCSTLSCYGSGTCMAGLDGSCYCQQ